MSLRALIRITIIALASIPLSILLWDMVGPWTLLAGPGLLVLALGYLLLTANGIATTRWQLRYYAPERTDVEQQAIEDVLCFLTDKARRVTIEANAEGLFLTAPRALDRYVEVQLMKVLPEAKISRVKENENNKRGAYQLFTGPLTSEILAWATQDTGRRVYLHLHRGTGTYATLVAQSHEDKPPGRWSQIPLSRLMGRLWQNSPIWDELSAGVQLASLLPPARPDSVYSSRSRLLQLIPPADYQPNNADGRFLGETMNRRALNVEYNLPLFTVNAPSQFLVRQASQDLESGHTVVVCSPDRRTLEQIGRQAHGPTYWLDQENSLASTHLAIAAAGEWPALDIEVVIEVAQDFLADLGLDTSLPTTRAITKHLVTILATSAQLTESDFTFTDLYAVSQSIQALRAFSRDLLDLFPDPEQALHKQVTILQALLDRDKGYVQAHAVLSRIRTVLKPLQAGPLHNLAQPPFLNSNQVLSTNSLLLVPMTNADFPQYNHLLRAMLDLVLNRVLATAEDDCQLALHLHDPHRYRNDGGLRWINTARRDEYFSLVLDVHDPDRHAYLQGEDQGAELIFRCPESLAAALVRDWKLPCTITDLTDLPAGIAIARLPNLLVALKTGEDR